MFGTYTEFILFLLRKSLLLAKHFQRNRGSIKRIHTTSSKFITIEMYRNYIKLTYF